MYVILFIKRQEHSAIYEKEPLDIKFEKNLFEGSTKKPLSISETIQPQIPLNLIRRKFSEKTNNEYGCFEVVDENDYLGK